MENDKVSVLFICTGNSCRSQMAEGFVKHWAGDSVRVKSAGSHPAMEVARLAIQVMREIGIDISDQYTKHIDSVKDGKWDWVITVCDFAKDFCPVFQGRHEPSKRLHWSIDDPVTASNEPEKALEAYRDARDELGTRIATWLTNELGIEASYPFG